MKCNVRPYEGDEPYIFFSYCHEDAWQNYPIIERMSHDGYRIWYDDGLHPGDEWPERIAEKLDGCTVCMAALSQNFSQSHNCKNELTFAINNQKPLLIIKLEDFPMSMGMRLQLANTQYIEKYQYDSENIFFVKLYSNQLKEMKNCKGEAVLVSPLPVPSKLELKPEPDPDSNLDSVTKTELEPDVPSHSPIVVQCSSSRLFQGSYPKTSIGRNKNECDIYFPENRKIGRHHVDIVVHENKFYVDDKKSLNHTWVNGKRLEKGGRCEIGACGEIRIADETLIVAFGEVAKFITEHKLLVKLQSETTKESRYLLTGEFVLGRGHVWSDGVLSEKHISRTHAILKITKGGCMLSDVSTYNQTWVNERRIPAKEETMLADKDKIRIGGKGGEIFTVYIKTLEEADE